MADIVKTEEKGLGCEGYQPTTEEVAQTIDKGRNGLAAFKYAIFLIWLHEMYKEEPYNCKTICEFALKYFKQSRAGLYRVLNEVKIHFILYGSYSSSNAPVSEIICQKLMKLKKALKEGLDGGDDAIRSFWSFMNHEQPEKITAELVDTYIAMLALTGKVVSLEHYKGQDYNFKGKATVKQFALFEKSFVEDEPIDLNKEYPEDSPLEPSTDEEGDCQFVDEDDKLYSEADKGEEFGSIVNDGSQEAGEVELSAEQESQPAKELTGFEVYMQNMGQNYTVNLKQALKLVSAMNAVELMELQNILDHLLSIED